MKRSPIRQKQGLAPLSIVGFEIGAAGLAELDTKVFLSVNGQGREPVIAGNFAEGAANSPVSPACAATTARK
jgi:hypothetical protein